MAFRIQDLMTDVLPESVRWASCPGGTSCGGGGFAAASNTGKGGDKSPHCNQVSGAGGGGGRPKPSPRPPQGYTDLALLQQQLQRTLDGSRA